MQNLALPGMRLSLPDGWQAATAVFVAPPDNASRPALPTASPMAAFRSTLVLSVEPVPAGTSAEQVLQGQLQHRKASGEQVRVLERSERGGELWVELGMNGPGGLRLRQLVRLFVAGGGAYTVAATVLDDPSLATRRADVDRALASFSADR
jgi:hypothetical protein